MPTPAHATSVEPEDFFGNQAALAGYSAQRMLNTKLRSKQVGVYKPPPT
jgi:hypothetical protein